MKSNAFAAESNGPDFFSAQVLEARRFYFDLNPPRNRRLVVVCGGCESCAPDYSIERATFPFHSIEYVAGGRGVLDLMRRRHTLQPGTLFSYGPGVRHRIASNSDNPLVKYFVDFTGSEAPALLNGCGMPPGAVARVFPPHEVRGLFEELVAGGVRGTSRAGALCAKLLESIALKVPDCSAPAKGPATRSFITYQQCRQHIQANFRRLRSVQEIAAECHIDAAYLCRIFRRYGQESPYQCLLRLKMNWCVDDLLRPDALIKQVAEEAGFSDQFHFSRAFKAVFGVSPDAFRRLR